VESREVASSARLVAVAARVIDGGTDVRSQRSANRTACASKSSATICVCSCVHNVDAKYTHCPVDEIRLPYGRLSPLLTAVQPNPPTTIWGGSRRAHSCHAAAMVDGVVGCASSAPRRPSSSRSALTRIASARAAPEACSPFNRELRGRSRVPQRSKVSTRASSVSTLSAGAASPSPLLPPDGAARASASFLLNGSSSGASSARDVWALASRRSCSSACTARPAGRATASCKAASASAPPSWRSRRRWARRRHAAQPPPL